MSRAMKAVTFASDLVKMGLSESHGAAMAKYAGGPGRPGHKVP